MGLLHIESFMAVTGRKEDIWLVKPVSVPIIPICILHDAHLLMRLPSLPLLLVAMAMSAGFAAIDFCYTANNTIRRVYAVDGVVQTACLLCWIILWNHRSKIEGAAA